jgi:hypothetical protein
LSSDFLIGLLQLWISDPYTHSETSSLKRIGRLEKQTVWLICFLVGPRQQHSQTPTMAAFLTQETANTIIQTLQPIRDLTKNWDIDIAAW